MIVDLVVKVVLGIFKAILGLLPEYVVEFGSASHIGVYYVQVNEILPLTEILAGIGLLLSARAFVSLWHVGQWVYDKFPLKAT